MYYLSTAAQRNVLHFQLKFISLAAVYRTAVVGAETVIRALQLATTQLQWTMNVPQAAVAKTVRKALFNTASALQ